MAGEATTGLGGGIGTTAGGTGTGGADTAGTATIDSEFLSGTVWRFAILAQIAG